MVELKIDSLENIDKPAHEFVKLLNDHRIFAFYGEMGAGKTTFIKAICKAAGVPDLVSSPSFAIVYEYISITGKIIYHFDLFRIKDISDLFDLGYEDYFYSGNICFIEWPELAEELLPEHTVKVRFNINSDGSRLLRIGE